MESLKHKSTVAKLCSVVLLIGLLGVYLLIPFVNKPSKAEVLDEVFELQIEHHQGVNSDMSLLLEAETLLTHTLKYLEDDTDIIRQRLAIRLLLKHYEGALADIESLDSLNAGQPLRKTNYTKCTLLELLGRPVNIYLPCYRESLKELRLLKLFLPFNNNVTCEVGFVSISAEDFDSAKWALDKLKSAQESGLEFSPGLSREVSDDFFDACQGDIKRSMEILRGPEGRKGVTGGACCS